jgi:hypothetical protein
MSRYHRAIILHAASAILNDARLAPDPTVAVHDRIEVYPMELSKEDLERRIARKIEIRPEDAMRYYEPAVAREPRIKDWEQRSRKRRRR